MTHARNCDLLELIDRLNMANQLENVFQKHPNLRCTNRLDHSKGKTTYDRSSYHDWIGDLYTKNINLQIIWKLAYAHVTDDLMHSFNYLSDDLKIIDPDKVDMLNPFGKELDTAETIESTISVASMTTSVDDQEDSSGVDDLFDDDDEELHDFIELEVCADSRYVVVEDGETTVHKSNAINSILNNKTRVKSSTDRLRRVQSNKVVASNDKILDNITDQNSFKLTDTIIALAKISSISLGVIVITVHKMNISNEYVSFISMDRFNETKFTGKILKFDSFENDLLIWSGKYGESVTVDGLVSIVCKVHIKRHEKGFINYIEKNNLFNSMNVLKTVYESTTPTLQQVSSPYSCIVLDSFLISGVIQCVDDSRKKICKICKISTPLVKMRPHVAKHFLNNETEPNFCGFCGVACNSTTSLKISSGFGKNATYSTYSDCAYYYKFNYASAENPSRSQPCSNRPMHCLQCNNVYWSYTLKLHYEEKHFNINCPHIISNEEKQAVLKYKW